MIFQNSLKDYVYLNFTLLLTFLKAKRLKDIAVKQSIVRW